MEEVIPNMKKIESVRSVSAGAKQNNKLSSYLVTVPSNAKMPKIHKNGHIQEIDFEHTIEDIGEFIKAGEKVVEHIQNIEINCCSQSTCTEVFTKCFKIKSKVGDAKVSVV